MAEPVVVLRTPSQIEATVVRGLLDAHGIPAAISAAEGPPSMFPPKSGFTEIVIRVPAIHAADAERIISDSRAEAEPARVVPFREAFSALEQRLGYRFRDSGLLEQALTHRSRAQEDVTGGVFDNESLEFLGDAVLGLVVADLLFRRFPDFDEGHKSKLKASLVSEAPLARLGEGLGLGEHLLLGRGEEKTGGRRKRALLANAVEALIAAIYLDGGLDAAREFLGREIEPVLARAGTPGLLLAFTGDFKSALQEHLQSSGAPRPEYRLVAESGPAHHRVFDAEVWADGQCLARGTGHSRKEAEQQAARLGLEVLLSRTR